MPARGGVLQPPGVAPGGPVMVPGVIKPEELASPPDGPPALCGVPDLVEQAGLCDVDVLLGGYPLVLLAGDGLLGRVGRVADDEVDLALRESTRALTAILPNSVTWLFGIFSVSSRSRCGAGFHSGPDCGPPATSSGATRWCSASHLAWHVIRSAWPAHEFTKRKEKAMTAQATTFHHVGLITLTAAHPVQDTRPAGATRLSAPTRSGTGLTAH